MRVVLFDWIAGGHHPRYLERVTEALRPGVDVVIAAPDATLEQLGGADAEREPLGPVRPREDYGRPLRPQARALAARELELFRKVARRTRPDHLFHLYADGVLRELALRGGADVPTSICVFYPSLHYPRAYGSSLTPRQRARALQIEVLVGAWRRRREAHALFALDPEAVDRWNGRGGAPAHWFPEPPVPAVPSVGERRGVVVFGTLSRHKGIDRLADALTTGAEGIELVLAGTVQPEFAAELDGLAARMRACGVTVSVDTSPHDEADGLRRLAAARCVVLPYPNHQGMSRVLLEAAAAGTPLVVHDYGLLGGLVRRHGIGRAVDAADPSALRDAVVELVADPRAVARFAPALRAFAELYSAERFKEQVCTPFTGAVDQAPAPDLALALEGS